MNPLPLSQIAQLSGGSLSSGDGTVVIDKVSTDSRTIKRGELFVALRGENFDGHNFVEAVATSGAAGAIVDFNWKGKVPHEFRAYSCKRHVAGVPAARGQLPEVTGTACGRNNRKQRQNQHEGFRCGGSSPPVSSHEDTRKFQ